MLYEPTSLAMTIHVLAKALREEYKLDPEPIFAAAGVDLTKSVTPQCRYPLSTMKRLWDLSREASGDPAIGLHTGWHVKPANFYAFGYSWLASETLLGGMRRLCRYHSLLSTAAVEIGIRDAGDTYALWAGFPDESRCPPKEGIDAGMTALLRLCDIVAEKKVRPLRAELTCPSNVHPEAYREAIGAPLQFNSEVGAFYFDKATLEERLPGATPDVAAATDKIAEQYIELLDPHQVASQVRRLLIALLPSGHADQDRIANRLNRSASTLQRQLQAEGTNYRGLLDDTRRDLAEQYLRERKHSHAQIAYLLGFSDQSNFSRAFRRWTGASPRAFQSQQGSR